MNFASKIITTLSIPVVSFLPIGIVSATTKQDLKGAKDFKPAFKDLSFSNLKSNEKLHPRGDGTKCANYKTGTSASGDVTCGFGGSGIHIGYGYDIQIVGLEDYVAIDGSISRAKVSDMVLNKKTYTLRDINASFSNKNDVLSLFSIRSNFQKEEDGYLNAQDHSSDGGGNRMGKAGDPEFGNELGWGRDAGFGGNVGGQHREVKSITNDYGRNASVSVLRDIGELDFGDRCRNYVPFESEVFNNDKLCVNKFYTTNYNAVLAHGENCTGGFIFSLNPDAGDVSMTGKGTPITKSKKLHFDLNLNIKPNGKNPYVFYLINQNHSKKGGDCYTHSAVQRFDSFKNSGPEYNGQPNPRDGYNTRGNGAGTNTISGSFNFQGDEVAENPLDE